MPKVILVDTADNEIGQMEKLEAHQKGLLHRAISVFILNENGEMLLQRRALEKYHSPGLWTNAACSHPEPGEDSLTAAVRRLKEEMGIETGLKPVFTFTYKADFENGLTEYELDHVFVGKWEGSPTPDPGEVAEWKWIGPKDLILELEMQPDRFTVWFKLGVERVWEYNKQK